LEKNFHCHCSKSWISQFLRRKHLSYQLTNAAKYFVENSESKYQEAVSFIKRVRALKLRPDQIVCLDKTKFYYSSLKIKHIGIKGGGTPRRFRMNRGSPDTVYTMLVGNGTLSPLYIETSRKFGQHDKIPPDVHLEYLPRNTFRRGETGVLRCLKFQTRNDFFQRGDLILTDNEASFKTEKVRKFLRKKGILYDNFPPLWGHLLNPCDENFHGNMKLRYWRYINKFYNFNYSKKLHCINEAYFAEKESAINYFFRKCGIIGDVQPETVLNGLIFKGLFPSKKWILFHKFQLQCYLEWKFGKVVTIEQAFGTKFELFFDQK